MPATTKPQIQVLINAIQPEVEFPAESMNVLLTQMLNASFGPLWGAGIYGVTPAVDADETFGYRAGSLGHNSADSRSYLCVSATAGAAVWTLLTEDNGLEIMTMTNGGIRQAIVSTANINLTANVANFTLRLPAFPYTGKSVRVFIDPVGTVSGTLTVTSSTGAAVSNMTAAALDSYIYTYNGSAWILIGFSGTIV
jgi:hypothetical protein